MTAITLRIRLGQLAGAAALLVGLGLLAASNLAHASAPDGVGGTPGQVGAGAVAGSAAEGHDAGHDAAAHKEHLRHFSLASLLISEDTGAAIRAKLGPAVGLEKSLVDGEDFASKGQLGHVFWALVALVILLATAMAARQRLSVDADAGVLPSTRLSPLLFFEIVVGAVWNLMRSMMAPAVARQYFPIVATCAVYILTMNLMALLPLGAPATDNLNTNIGMGLTIFFATHYAGIRAQGVVHYAKHFAGPVLALAPLMVVIEIVGHLVRPISLSLRLMGNMTGDHNVLFEFTYFKLPLVPLPVMFLGLMVCVVQTIVFVMLSTVYLAMATASGHDDAHGHS